MVKKSTLRKGVKVSRWNGISRDTGLVLKSKKDNIIVGWNGEIEEIEKVRMKYQMRREGNDIFWSWNAPFEIEEALVTKTDGEWEITYDRINKMRSMRFTGEIWFLRHPYDCLSDQGYKVSEDNAVLLQHFGDGMWPDTAYWFCMAADDYKDIADEIIKWMIGPLKELISVEEISLRQSALNFFAPDFGKLVKQVTDKTITFTMGKEILGRMYKGEKLDDLLEDPKYKATSGDELTGAVKKIIIDNPAQIDELKNGKDKILGWLVGQVMKELKGKANAAEVNKLFREELELN